MALLGRTRFEISLSQEDVKKLQNLLDDKDEEPPEDIKQVLCERTATIDHIKTIHAYFQGELKVHELLCSSEIMLPEPVFEPRNQQLEARIQKLKKMVEQQQYDHMTKNVRAKGRDPDDSMGAQLQFMNKQLIAVAQFIFSVGSGFVFGFYGVELIVGDLDFGFRLLLGVICSLVIALAEIYFLAKIIAELDLEGIVKTDEEEEGKRRRPQSQSSSQAEPNTEKLHQD